MIRVKHARLFSLAICAAITACSGGGGGVGDARTGGDFVVLKTEPATNGTLFLNEAIRVDFSNPVNLDSVDLSTVSFQVSDQLGNAVNEPVAGSFALDTSPGDATVGRRLLFVPRLPTNDTFTNGGFRPGRTYTVQLVGGSTVNNTVLRDQFGKGLAVPVSFRFSTSDGTTPAQLFRNPAAGGPRRAGFAISPTPDSTGVVLNKLGTDGVEIRLRFDQPLNPSSANIPIAIPTDALTRSSNNRGRIFLEYDDPVLGENVWIPTDSEIEENAVLGATVVLRPLGVLPNNATVRVIVERTLEDISGESNVANAAYDRVFGTFQTKRAYEQQFDAIVEDFTSAASIDAQAAFPEPVADVGPGYIKAGFAFEGTTTGAEFEPTVPTTILNTNFTQVTPKVGSPYNVSGGVFNFKNVKIPSGRTVLGQGSNPMVWLCSGTFEVAGLLSVRGGDGTRVTTASNANIAKAGGAGVCGGGDGGAGSPSTTARDAAGGDGKGPLQTTGQGGIGGALSCTAGCNRGAGGGGGSLATQGDPQFKQKTQLPTATLPFPQFQQQTGIGGNGCLGASGAVTRQVQGSIPGPTVFTDARNDNNFWGVGVRFDGSPLRITGELAVPLGGGGGGGGGDLSYSNCDSVDPNFEQDKSGGGGGGGGGVLIVKALGPIIVSEGGRITADGGSGGGGEPSGSCGQGGGGGAGAGGMVILMSATRIDINARGTSGRFLYGASGTDNNDYDFSISADGGACVTGSFTAPVVQRKYQVTTAATGEIGAAFATLYDSAPLGGFGGLGIVQLMAPPGANTDGTNTRLDDNINFFRASVLTTGAAKQALLGWRGFPNALGLGVDDSGTVIPTTFTVGVPPNQTVFDLGGDIRPAPVLLPTPIASTSRLRSNWIDTGFSSRRGIALDDDLPRGVIEQGGAQAGPRYEFDGVNPTTGYAAYSTATSAAQLQFQIAVQADAIQGQAASITYLGQPAYRVTLVDPVLGTAVDRFVQYEAEVLDASNSQVGSFRILAHTDRELTLAAESGAFPATAAKVRVRAKFFDISTGGNAGLGGTYLGTGGTRVPVANVRIGFAFHQDPASPTATRFPASGYLYNLSDPAVQEQIRVLHAQFVQWDVLFDAAFKAQPSDVPPALSPDTPRPQLEFLRLPFRF